VSIDVGGEGEDVAAVAVAEGAGDSGHGVSVGA
jgi:hypothetical protein